MIVSWIAVGSAHGESPEDYWPTWRGPNFNGVATNGNPPITWSETNNIKWKVKMPDSGECTPVVWGNKIFIQTAVPLGQEHGEETEPSLVRNVTVPWRFGILCLDRETGETLWERIVREEVPHEGHHVFTSFSSYSPVTDGNHVWASFGSRGLHCYDLDGNHQWSTDLVKLRAFKAMGEGGSPALAGDNIVVLQDHEGDSKISAFNKHTGELSWETDRDEGTTWATPLVVTVNGSQQIIATGARFVRGYDATTGEVIWKCAVQLETSGAIASPVAGFGKVFTTSGDHRSILKAIQLGLTGDVTDLNAVAWQDAEGAPYVSTPLLYDENIYFVQGNRASLSCYKADTGTPVYLAQRLEGMKDVFASPVGAAGRIYIADRRGNVLVMKHGDTFEVLATNTLDDAFDASPVIVGDELYLKGEGYLYCIAVD